MLSNLSACLDFVLRFEGGFTKNRADPGNWTGGKVGVGVLKGTNMGIAANTFPDLDIEHLTKAQATSIYKARYWDKIGGDRLPEGLDLAGFDLAVNSGAGKTQAWLPAVIKARPGDVAAQVRALCARRLSFMRGLRAWASFGGGWSRRVAACEALGVKMALKAQGRPPESIKVFMQADAAKAQQKVSKAAGTAVASGSASAVTQAGHVDPSQPTWLLVALGVGLLAVTILIVIKAMQHKARADAYEAEAKGA